MMNTMAVEAYVGRRAEAMGSRPDRRPRGMALFVVIVVVALLSLSALGFLVSMETEHLAARALADQKQVQTVADSGIALVEEITRLSRSQRDALGGMNDNPPLFRDVRVDHDRFGQRHGRFCVLSRRYDESSGDGAFVFGLQPTTAKLALQAVVAWELAVPGSGRSALMELPGMTESVADALLDWVDADDVAREQGAESEFYLGQNPRRTALNGLPLHIDDLLAVRGMDAWRLLGSDTGPFRIIDPTNFNDSPLPRPAASGSANAMSQAGSDRPSSSLRGVEQHPPWSHYLTLHSRHRDETYGGREPIDVNASGLRQLQSHLREVVADEAIMNFVLAYRLYGPSNVSFERAQSEPIPNLDVARSPEGEYGFDSVLELIDAVVDVPSGSGSESAKSYRSPFWTKDPESLTRFVQFADQVRVGRMEVIENRIDVNHAPPAVLAAIPDVTDEILQLIVAARDVQSMEPRQRIHPSWLLAEGVLSLDTLRAIEPYITVGCDVFEAHVVALYDAESPVSYQRVIVDGTGTEPVTVYFKDLRRVGKPFRFSDLVPPLPSESTDPIYRSPGQDADSRLTGR